MLSLVEHEKSFITSGPDQTTRMHTLIWTFAVCIWHKGLPVVVHHIAKISLLT